jgi:hypothetical protein
MIWLGTYHHDIPHYMHSLFHTWKKRKENSKISQPKPQNLDAHTICQESYWNILLVFEYKIQTKINYAITGKKQNKTKHNKTGEIACQK